MRFIGPFREAFVSKRVAFMAPLGFSSGLPLLLTGGTLSAWMATVGVDLTTIGIFAFVSMPYSLKPLWAPLLDRYRVPWLTRRRGWIVTTQLALMVAIFVLGTLDPVAAPFAVATCAFFLSFCAASQDIVVDAYRTDVLKTKERASGVAIFVALYRLALIVAGAGALILSAYVSWQYVYYALAGLMSVGIVATLFTPVPASAHAAPPSLRKAIVEPFVDFFTRRRAVVLIIIVMTYKVGDEVAGRMLMPFLLRTLEFSAAEVGAVAKGLGLAATIIGALVGGGVVAKIGIRKSLIIFGILQAVANVLYAAMAVVGQDHTLLVVAIGVDNLFNGLGTAAFVAFLMSLCNARFSATQYALLSSAMGIVGRFLAMGSGWIATEVGWVGFFILTIIAAAPALILLFFIPEHNGPKPESESEPEP